VQSHGLFHPALTLRFPNLRPWSRGPENAVWVQVHSVWAAFLGLRDPWPSCRLRLQYLKMQCSENCCWLFYDCDLSARRKFVYFFEYIFYILVGKSDDFE
jgi:hypothetical protein